MLQRCKSISLERRKTRCDRIISSPQSDDLESTLTRTMLLLCSPTTQTSVAPTTYGPHTLPDGVPTPKLEGEERVHRWSSGLATSCGSHQPAATGPSRRALSNNPQIGLWEQQQPICYALGADGAILGKGWGGRGGPELGAECTDEEDEEMTQKWYN